MFLTEAKTDRPINLALSRICMQALTTWLHAILRKSIELKTTNIDRLETATKKSSKYLIDLDKIDNKWKIDDKQKFIDITKLKSINVRKNKIKDLLINFKLIPSGEPGVNASFFLESEKEKRNMTFSAFIPKSIFTIEGSQLRIDKRIFSQILKKAKEALAHETTHSAQKIYTPEERKDKEKFLFQNIDAIVYLNTGGSDFISKHTIPLVALKNFGRLETPAYSGLAFPTPSVANAIIDWWRNYTLSDDLKEIEAYSKQFMEAARWDRKVKSEEIKNKELLFIKNSEKYITNFISSTLRGIGNLLQDAVYLSVSKGMKDDPEIGTDQIMSGYRFIMNKIIEIYLNFYGEILLYSINKYKLNLPKELIPDLIDALDIQFGLIYQKTFKNILSQLQPSSSPESPSSPSSAVPKDKKKRMLEID